MTELLHNLRFALRTWSKAPGFAAVAIVALALGIAANVTVFSVANSLLWGRLPVKNPQRMVMFSEGAPFSWPEYLAYRDRTATLFDGGVAAHTYGTAFSFKGAGDAERVLGSAVSVNYFSMLGMKMALGRPFLPEEDQVIGRDPVVVLGHALWQRHFGGDPNVVGRVAVLNRQPYTVIGIAPEEFSGTESGTVSEFWVPLAMREQVAYVAGGAAMRAQLGHRFLMLNARLQPGVGRAEAMAAINTVRSGIRDDGSVRGLRTPITLQTAGGMMGRSWLPVDAVMTVVAIVVGLVLLAACANVANLLLARAAGRQKELATRLAIGAGRKQLVRQLLTESALLALSGGAAGFLLAALAARALSRVRLPLPGPNLFDFNVDLRVAAFALGLSLVTTLLFGLAPALRATRPALVEALKADSAISAHAVPWKIGNPLVVLQVAISLMLLASAGLFVRGLQKASQIELGFNPGNILLMTFHPKLQQYSPLQTQQLLEQLQTQVVGLPGVLSVTFVDNVPLSSGGTTFTVRGGNVGRYGYDADIHTVGARYFETLELPLLRGRTFASMSEENAAVINETLAARLFGNQDPMDRSIQIMDRAYSVVGVARDSKARTLGETPRGSLYLPIGAVAEPVMGASVSILMKTSNDPRSLAPAVRSRIAALDPNLAVTDVETMQEHVDKSLLLPKVFALVFGAFGAAGLTLAAIGLYGVLSYSVRRRSREIGIRMALGNNRSGVLTMVLRQGLTVTLIGLALGLASAFSVGRAGAKMMSGLLYGVGGSDLATFVAVPLVLLAAALLAIVIPACRAARVDPTVALRYE